MSDFIVPGYNYEAEIAAAKAAGNAEGLATGLAQGIEQGTATGIAQGTATGLAQGIAQGTATGIAQGTATGFAQGSAAEYRPHFQVGLQTNKIVTSADQLTLLGTNQIISSTGVTVNSNGTIKLDSNVGGVWHLFLCFSWLMDANHNAQDSIFNHAFIYQGNTRIANGSTRRRHNADYFGTCSAATSYNLSGGSIVSAQCEFDYNATPDMTVFKDAPSKPSGSQIPASQTDGSYPYSTFGPACRFVGIKQ